MQYALDHLPKAAAQELYTRFVAFEKQHGSRCADLLLVVRLLSLTDFIYSFACIHGARAVTSKALMFVFCCSCSQTAADVLPNMCILFCNTQGGH
jgi:hypothetical protein